MKKETILIISDEEIIQVSLKVILGQKFHLVFAENAKQAIDLATDRSINLAIIDLQIPEFSNDRLLKYVMVHSSVRSVPVVCLTGQGTEDIQAVALTFGAADFIPKSFLFAKKIEVKQRLDDHLFGVEKHSKLPEKYKVNLKSIIKKLQVESSYDDFFSVCRSLAVGLMNSFSIDYISFWNIQWANPSLILSVGDQERARAGSNETISELVFEELKRTKRPSLTNNIYSGNNRHHPGLSQKVSMGSEIVVPLFKMDKSTFVNNRMVIPGNTPLFGCVILKRSTMFTATEYKILSRFVIQCGTILWDHYKKQYSNTA